jgi:hypothetical protein
MLDVLSAFEGYVKVEKSLLSNERHGILVNTQTRCFERHVKTLSIIRMLTDEIGT